MWHENDGRAELCNKARPKIQHIISDGSWLKPLKKSTKIYDVITGIFSKLLNILKFWKCK